MTSADGMNIILIIRGGEVVTALATHLCGQGLHHTWVEFFAVSLLFSQKFFPGYSRFLFLNFFILPPYYDIVIITGIC